jgi:tetratricopeptide (TPR) repeat protein
MVSRPVESPPAGRRAFAFACGTALLILAVAGAGAALRLGRAAIVGGAYRADPLVGGLIDRTGVLRVPPAAIGYQDAAEAASLDFRYPYRFAQELWLRDTGTGPDRSETVLANELFREATIRAPTFASARYYYAVTAYGLGETEEADRNALAALRLAPLHLDIRRKVGAYFERRFRETRSDSHLAAAFQAMGAEREALIQSVLSDPMISYERVVRAFAAARIEGAQQISVLVSMARWDWAIRVARELDQTGGGEQRREGDVRTRYSTWLLGRNARSAALREAEAGAALLGAAYRSHGVLARARLLAGQEEAALDAFQSALAEGTRVAEVEAAFREAGTEPGTVVSFFERVTADGGGGAEAKLALARARIEAGRLLEARNLLRAMIDANQAFPEANYQMARTFIRSGNPEMALPYAREAAAAERAEERYAQLVRSMEKEIRCGGFRGARSGDSSC